MLQRNHGRRRRKAAVDWYETTDSQQTRSRRKMTDFNMVVDNNLEEVSNNREKTKDESSRRQRTEIDPLCKHITTISHICIVCVSTYIIYLCFTEEFEFFTWHPFLYSIGWMCLMTEAVLVLTKNNIISSKISHTWRIRYHWIMQLIALSCCLAGFIVVVVNKNLKNKQHWKSWHGLLGLLSMISALVPTSLSGLAALFSLELSKRITPKLNKLIHGVTGIISLVFGAITMVLSLYTNWFRKKTDGDVGIFTVCLIFMCFGILWSMWKPILSSCRRIITLAS